MTLQERYDERAKLVKDQRDLLYKVEQGKRDLNAEETGQYEERDKDIVRLTGQIDREQKLADLEERERKLDAAAVPGPRLEPGSSKPGKQRSRVAHNATEQYAETFWYAIRNARQALTPEQYAILRGPEARDLQVGTDSEGGYTVPDEFNRTLIQALKEANIMRTLATVIQTSSGTMEIPTVASQGAADWTAEEAAYNESDDAFGQVTLTAHKATRIIKVSEELLNDSAFDLQTYLATSFGDSFGILEETAFVVGDGSSKPTGVSASATVGVTAAADDAITADELISLYHALGRRYRGRGTWLANDATIAAVRKLKDTTGQYLWQPGLQAGEPDRLLNRPIYAAGDMATMAIDAITVLFGDFSYYWIADRGPRVFRRLDELYAANGQVGFRAYQRVDGKLTLATAIQSLEMAAS